MEQQRTSNQNRSIHLWCTMLAQALNEAGLDQRKVLKPSIAIPWTPTAIKSQIWKPIQEAQLGKESTTQLTTAQVSEVYETINRHLGQTFGIHCPFPSEEGRHLSSNQQNV